MPNQKEAPVESEELLYQIALACVQQGVCSINSIQNGFGLGFNRAQRIVQILEEREIVSPKNLREEMIKLINETLNNYKI